MPKLETSRKISNSIQELQLQKITLVRVQRYITLQSTLHRRCSGGRLLHTTPIKASPLPPPQLEFELFVTYYVLRSSVVQSIEYGAHLVQKS